MWFLKYANKETDGQQRNRLTGSGPPSSTWLLGSTRVYLLIDTSIGSAVFKGLRYVTNRQTDTHTDHATPSV